ncbi:MAG: excinuclease ABC subunit UvrC [Clostridia bacterium]|nr:excinuclease ABC subunit UvrC [Clostridia bacterium]
MSERNEFLRKKAMRLPLCPGVYIMKDRDGEVIYVGKSAVLKNRVSQYFGGGAKNAKTRRMVSNVYDFDYILCDTEMEALALENSKIKQFSPKYNIKLKDDKSYPYIKITREEYPRLVLTRKRETDGGSYFGPYSNAATVRTIIRTVSKTVGLPVCKKVFPRDIGKERPCIYAQIGRCAAPCTGAVSREAYAELVKSASVILKGDISEEKKRLTELMESASEELNFELAAKYRDRINALAALYGKQKVVSSPDTNVDAVGIYSDDFITVFSFFFIRSGMIFDTDSYEFTGGHIGGDEITSFLSSFYENRFPPKQILVSDLLPDGEAELLTAHLSEVYGKRIEVKNVKRGKNRALCEMAAENAAYKAKLAKETDEKSTKILAELSIALGLEVVPERIEAYDISNFGDENITAGMIVLNGTSFSKQDYRIFNIKESEHEDDYASMREVITRRIKNTTEKKSKAYPVLPDLILLDGGKTHVSAVRGVLDELGVDVPVFGMVKDDKHKTRALCDDENEVDIINDKTLFTFIYRIQEEVHRFAISRMSGAKRKTLRTSSLEKIKGVGPAKAKILLSSFGSLAAVKKATVEELAAIKGIDSAAAANVYEYFNGEKK